MEFLELMLTRESCRHYTGEAVSREALLKIVEAGRLSPSGCNAQPWKFLVIDSPEAKEKMCDALVLNEAGMSSCGFREEAGAFIVLVEQPAKVMPFVVEYYNDTQRFAQGDIGQAVMNMCYQATELGLGTCIIGMFDQEKLEKHFNIPSGNTVRLVLTVGYSAEGKEPRKKMRKPLEEICSFNGWE